MLEVVKMLPLREHAAAAVLGQHGAVGIPLGLTEQALGCLNVESLQWGCMKFMKLDLAKAAYEEESWFRRPAWRSCSPA